MCDCVMLQHARQALNGDFSMVQEFKNWLNSPFNSGMSASKWFAFVGLLLAITMVWGVILKRIEEA